MRRFIYLDTDTLNSYLAQIFDGVIQSRETEKTVGKKKEKQHRFANSLGGQIAFKLFGKGIDANAQATYEHLKTVANDEMVRDVQTKIMHDNAFNEFASYLKENNLLTGTEIGNFISIEDDFYIFDIAFFQKLFGAGGFVSGLKEIQKSNFQKEAEKKVQECYRPREGYELHPLYAGSIQILSKFLFASLNFCLMLPIKRYPGPQTGKKLTYLIKTCGNLYKECDY